MNRLSGKHDRLGNFVFFSRVFVQAKKSEFFGRFGSLAKGYERHTIWKAWRRGLSFGRDRKGEEKKVFRLAGRPSFCGRDLFGVMWMDLVKFGVTLYKSVGFPFREKKADLGSF
jgi:hypothetical protein